VEDHAGGNRQSPVLKKTNTGKNLRGKCGLQKRRKRGAPGVHSRLKRGGKRGKGGNEVLKTFRLVGVIPEKKLFEELHGNIKKKDSERPHDFKKVLKRGSPKARTRGESSMNGGADVRKRRGSWGLEWSGEKKTSAPDRRRSRIRKRW